MPFCPNCGYEYLASVSTCPDCGEGLVAALPETAPAAQDPLVPVFDAPDEVTQVMVRQVLREAGIPSVAQSGLITWHDGVRGTIKGYHSRVLVFQPQVEPARRIIAHYLAEVRLGEEQRAVEQEAGPAVEDDEER